MSLALNKSEASGPPIASIRTGPSDQKSKQGIGHKFIATVF
jgi:hypothetical protein